jgi:uncharacterized protein YlzI (FlbEa/FlbD family)
VKFVLQINGDCFFLYALMLESIVNLGSVITCISSGKSVRNEKTRVCVDDGSIRIVSYDNADQVIGPKKQQDQFFLKRSFDVDITTFWI